MKKSEEMLTATDNLLQTIKTDADITRFTALSKRITLPEQKPCR